MTSNAIGCPTCAHLAVKVTTAFFLVSPTGSTSLFSCPTPELFRVIQMSHPWSNRIARSSSTVDAGDCVNIYPEYYSPVKNASSRQSDGAKSPNHECKKSGREGVSVRAWRARLTKPVLLEVWAEWIWSSRLYAAAGVVSSRLAGGLNRAC
jgi:hypothetical protein